MKLEQIYKDIIKEAKLIPEIGEGSSKPFSYNETFRSENNFAYEIDGRVENEDGKVLQLVPIRLQGLGFPVMVTQEDGDWEIDGYEDNAYGKFLNVNPGTTLKSIEIIFSQIRGDSFAEVNDRVFMFRLMATIKIILQDEFSKADPEYIVYAPTKQGDESAVATGRHKLYSAFIKKAIPGAQMFHNKKDDEIIYKLK